MAFSKRVLVLDGSRPRDAYRTGRRLARHRDAAGLPLFSVTVDPSDLARITASLSALPMKVRNRVYVRAFRQWGKLVTATAGPLLPKRTGRLRRSLGVRVRRYRNTVWAAVGGRVQKSSGLRFDKLLARKERLGRDFLGAGWRMHFAENGFTPGGVIAKGRRKGINTKAKTRVPGVGALFKAGTAHASKLAPLVHTAVDAAIREEGLR